MSHRESEAQPGPPTPPSGRLPCVSAYWLPGTVTQPSSACSVGLWAAPQSAAPQHGLGSGQWALVAEVTQLDQATAYLSLPRAHDGFLLKLGGHPTSQSLNMKLSARGCWGVLEAAPVQAWGAPTVVLAT